MCVLQVTAGILASVDGKKLVTDESWKCTTRSIKNWMSRSLNDNSWPNAVIAGTNSPSDIHKQLAGIDSSAKWIWTKQFKDPSIDTEVFCRIRLGKSVWLVVRNDSCL